MNSTKKNIKIAITGGPSGGKTTLIEALKKDLGHKVVLVSEAASIIYKGGFPRIKSAVAAYHAQRAIFCLQRELEDLGSDLASPAQLIVCDRGSLDGLAYWPYDESHFFSSLNTTKEIELARYDWIIHLDTAAIENYDFENPIRTESYQEAMILNDKIKVAWEGHPQRLIISSKEDFLSKMQASMLVIKNILSGVSHSNKTE